VSDLERLTSTLDALNVHYEQRLYEYDGKQSILVELDAPEHGERGGKVRYTGYSGFAWIFTFDTEGSIMEVGGYE